MAPLITEWWAAACSDLSRSEIIDAFIGCDILQAFDTEFQASAMRECTQLFKSSAVYGQWDDRTEGEESDPSDNPRDDDLHYEHVGVGLQLQVKDLAAPLLGEVSKEQEWEECVRCLNISKVAEDCDGSLHEVQNTLVPNCVPDFSSLELLGSVSCVMDSPIMKEQDSDNVSGLCPSLLLLLVCLIEVSKKEKADERRKLRLRVRKDKIRDKQTADALSGVSKLTELFPCEYYEYMRVEERRALEGEIVRKCISRSDNQCSFVEHRNFKVVYRRYASLFFLVGVDADENELAILEFIHCIVETLDRYFGNVCELDIMFHLEKSIFLLDEMVCNGCIVETNKTNILTPLQLIDKTTT
eukprot:gene12571-14855_t